MAAGSSGQIQKGRQRLGVIPLELGLRAAIQLRAAQPGLGAVEDLVGGRVPDGEAALDPGQAEEGNAENGHDDHEHEASEEDRPALVAEGETPPAPSISPPQFLFFSIRLVLKVMPSRPSVFAKATSPLGYTVLEAIGGGSRARQ
jgi:hypothetical protein